MSGEMSLKLIGMVWMAAAAVCLSSMSGTGAEPRFSGDWLPLSFRGPQHWSLVGPAWEEDEEGLVTPPEEPNVDLLAFYVGGMYSDVEAEFEFRWNINHCGAGFVVRAQDTSHYYLVHFPCCAQCNRAEHFWAVISKVDDSGWVEVLKMEMLHGVASEMEMWHKARVVVQGNEIRLWVDGRPFPVVRDDTYKSGYVGLESWTYAGPGSSFRNVRIRGQEVPPQPWDEALEPPRNWFHPYPLAEAQQSPSGITRAPNGELLMALNPVGLVRSLDNGRTWAPVEAEGWPGGWIHTLQDGRLITLLNREEDLLLAESTDNGKTWSEPEIAKRAPLVPPDNAPEMTLGGVGGFLELNDGTLLGFQVSRIPGYGHESGFDIWEWGMYGGCSAWSIRSTDGGRTWAAPVPLNGPPAIGQKYDLVECSSNCQTREGNVLSLVRPVHSPWLWEVWSENNGESWGPATSGPFPAYNNAMLPHASASGALLMGGRMPGLGLHVSHDSGMSWKHYRIDPVIWAGGVMYEVEPDVVLWVYMGEYDPHPDARAQFIRVTPDGLEPAREMLPTQ